MAKPKTTKKKRPAKRKPARGRRASDPGRLMEPAAAAKWIAAAGGADPDLTLGRILEDIAAGAPSTDGRIDPLVYSAWLIQRGADD